MSKTTKKDLDKMTHYINLYAKFGFMLTKVQQQSFELYFNKDLSYAEVAEILATSRSGAYDAVNKAVKKLEKIQQQKEI